MIAKRTLQFGLLVGITGLAVPVSAEDIRDVRPPVDFPPDYSLLILLAAVLVAAFIFWLIRFLKKRMTAAQQSPVVVRPPWEVAYEELDKLKAENLPRQGRVKEYYSRLSEIVRHYIEGRFGIRAPEMTTEEFLAYTNRTQALAARHKEALSPFLLCCDMVKFAKHPSDAREIEHSFQVARHLVDETKANLGK